MSALTIELLGRPLISRAGQPLDMRLRKELALLAFLAVEQEHRHSRDSLLGLLWPDVSEEAARNNLRVVLAGLRRLLGETGDTFLHADRSQVQFLPHSDHTLDVFIFRRLLADVRGHAHAAAERCDACVVQLAEAAELYRGDFLVGFSLPDSAPFEEWATVVREQLHQQQLQALDTLAIAHELRGDHAPQVAYARRQLALEPWRESAHAQLMRGLWASGQRGAALEQYHSCQRILGAELGLSPSPELTALYQQIRNNELKIENEELRKPATEQFSILNSQFSVSRHNLPTPPTSFVGREAELAGVSTALASARLVTLTGAGGSGKTRLALQVAATALPAYADGVWLIELASLRDPTLVPQAIAAALGLMLPPTTAQPLGALLSAALGSKQLLLVLDNCEHLARPCQELVALLMHACPRIRILATSREILHVAGELVWPVPPLALPDASVTDPEQIMAYESIRLFIERVRAVRPGFALTTRNAPAVMQICQRLDSSPLAIELAAARVRHLSIEEILARLDDRFSLLTAGSHTSLRQQTLRAAIDWSYALLPESEQRCFRRLGVFAGSFTLLFAEAVVGEPDEPNKAGASTIELLAQLIDKSLLVAEQRDDGMRYRMLESMRAYAQEKSAAAGEAAAAQDRHLACFVRLAEEAEPHLFSADQVAWLDTLATEHNNLRVALDWAVEQADAHAALRLVTALRSFWYTRGHYEEGRRRTLQILAMPAAQERTSARASALNAAGALLWARRDAAEARPLLDEALEIGRELDDAWNVGWALLYLGTIAYQQGDYGAAQPLLAAGLASCRAAGTPARRGVGWGLIFLGDLALDSGDLDRARAYFAESVDLLRQLSDYGLLAYPLRRLAYLAFGAGDFAAAKALCTESLRLNQAIDDRLAVVACLAAHAAIAAAEGQAASDAQRMKHLRHAANVCGVAAAQLEAIGAPLWPADAAAIERVAATVGDHLGAAAFADALAAGRAMSVEQVLARAAEPPADSSAPPGLPSQNLPAPLTPCIGREAELAELVALLHKPDVRLLTLVGVGGMGKTRLAQELGRASITAFADGVWFVPLAPLAAASAIAPAVLAALDEQSGGSDPRHALLHILRAKRVLLILDNFEHLLDGAAIVSDILQGAPQVTVIATSRERLNIRGEHQHLLQGLAFAPGASLAEAADAPAVRLFVECAQRVRPSFVVNRANLGAVLRICQLVEGMPLGIELAATWIETLSPTEIAAEIAQNADFLAAEWRDLPERQRSMRAVFDWSWQLLSDAERQVFKRLAIFRGGLTRQAAQAVADASMIVLTSLVRKSLLRWGQGHGGVGRYELHELLRQFAAEQLNALPDERAAVEVRHSQFYLSYVAERERHLARGDTRQASDEMHSELDNIRQAWLSATTHARIEDLGRAAYGLWQFYTVVGPRSEAAQMFRQVVEHGLTPLDHIPGDEQALQNRRRALSTVLAIHAILLVINGQNDRAAAAAQQAIDLGRASGGVDGEILGCWALGQTLQYSGQFLQARAMFEQTVQLCQDYHAGQATSEAVNDAEWQAYIWLQGIAVLFGDYASARAYVRQSLRICQTLGKQHGELICLFNLAQTAFFSGDHSTALQEYEQTLDLARALGNRHREAWTYIDMSRLMYVLGAYTRAHALAEQGLALARELDEVYLQISALATLGRLHSLMGDARGARAWLEQLTQLMATERLLPESTVEGLLALAIHAASVGDHQRALSYAEQGCQIVQENVIGHIRAQALIMLGHALVGVDRLADARTAYQQAITYCDELVDAPLATEPRAGLAQIALAHGDLVQAQRLVEPILTVLAEQPQVGWDTPFSVYLTCYRVLKEHGDPRAATVLQTGQRLLHEYANRITDDALRQSFFKNVATHRALLSSK